MDRLSLSRARSLHLPAMIRKMPAACGRLGRSTRSAVILVVLAVLPASARPALWMFPPPDTNGQSLRDLFSDPASWKDTRLRLDGIGYADHWLNSQFSDAELRAWLPMLARWHLKLGLEVGALKPWGMTADQAFAAGRRKWDRFIADGGRIDSIAMDEPFAFARGQMHQTMQFAADQTARFVALVRQNYPAASIGDIEPYPAIPTAELLGFVDAVQARLRQMNLRGLDFVRLDVDWMHFRPGDSLGQDGWQGVRDVQSQLARRSIPFSLVYWAANFPSLNRAGRADEHTWSAAIEGQGSAYQAAGGVPNEMVIENWVHALGPTGPDTEPDSFTGSVRDFAIRFAPGRAAAR